MFLWLAHFSNWLTGLNVFQYTTFRAVMAALTALAFSLLLGPWTIRKLTQLKVGQAVRTDGPQTHLIKNGTPTMGVSLGDPYILGTQEEKSRLADSDRHHRIHVVVGQLGKPVYLDSFGRIACHGRTRVLRRLAQSRL